MLPPLLTALVVGYLLGSLPFGYLVARARGVNIFEVGSKSPGATNVRRVLGSGPGNLVFALDALKGVLATGWMGFGFSLHTDGTCTIDWSVSQSGTFGCAVAGLIGALVGHSFSCFTKFRGGKGVATGAGGFAVLFPLGMGIALAVFGVTLAISRYVSLASMLAASSLPFAAFSFKQGSPMIAVSAVVAAFVIYRHRANLARLAAGTENKIGQKKSPAPTS